MVRIPEAGRSMPEQVEASRRGGGGPSRLKPLEGEVEDRTSSDVQIVWMTWV